MRAISFPPVVVNMVQDATKRTHHGKENTSWPQYITILRSAIRMLNGVTTKNLPKHREGLYPAVDFMAIVIQAYDKV